MLEFDKNNVIEYKTLTYIMGSICCEYCYKGLIEELFENDKIKSVKTNFDMHNKFNINLIIEYSEKYPKEELINYIEAKIQ